MIWGCVIVPPAVLGIKRQRQWSEQNVSDLPPGQTFTPRLLIMVSLRSSPETFASDSPRSSGPPFDQSRKTSTPTSSFFELDLSLTIVWLPKRSSRFSL